MTAAALDWPGRDGFRRMAVVLAATSAYVASLAILGFPWPPSCSSPPGRVPGAGRMVVCAVRRASAPALVLYALFIRLLGLSLPAGPLP
jgi:hypothetical protein